ncbi:MAG: hypothetical protein C0467_29095 [Planctomycetaceae bacterium]|nr:hypothetical protein [Planctomycetaceae bacterium]
MSRTRWFAALVLSLPLYGCITPPLYSAEPAKTPVKLPAFLGAEGKAFTPYSRGTKAVVVAFLSFRCPVARDYIEPLSKIAAEYGSKGVTVVGVIPTDDSSADVAKLATEYRAAFPVFLDHKLATADALQAGHTPEVFVLDADRIVRYRGRIDDKYGKRLKPNAQVTKHDLVAAIDEVLAGKPVTAPLTECVGCEIYRPKHVMNENATVTFHKDVLPILQNRCQECHRPGEAGPFSLLTYKQAVTWAADIKEYTQNRKMPPWKATGGLKFQHDRRMPDAEIDTLAKWVDGGTPEGDPKQAPAAKTFTKGWTLGEPDLVLTVEDDFHLGARGADHFRCFVLPTGLTEDKFVVAYEVRPGTPAVVHHVLNYFDATGTARKLDKEARKQARGTTDPDHGPGYESPMGIGFTPDDLEKVGGLGGWAPGLRGFRSPAGTGMFLPKGSDVVMQVHYHRNGKPEKDRTAIGLYFAKNSTELKRLKPLRVPGLVTISEDFAPFTMIPAGQRGYRVAGKVVIEEDCRLHAAMPHMHMLGTKVRITMTPPGGKEQPIVVVGEWDYTWQEVYHLVEVVEVKAGTVFMIEAEYDNSVKNPFNPNSPPRDVKQGPGTADEMLFGFLSVTSESPGGQPKARPLTERKHYSPK